jgi:formylglycine-generating enzyme required for sulfatase activity/tRNA A-37 threonylcarbamoyl transferase component Bud32
MLCPICKTELPKDTVVEGSGARKCSSCGATLDQYFEMTESVVLEKIGRFTLLHTLGEGGFGTVYKAVDAKLERTVALKVLHTKKMGSTDQEARLLREAKAASLLNHPGIVKIYELVDKDPIMVLVEEYVEGDTLDRLIQKKTLTQKEQLNLVAKIADALAYAHDNRVIHRDIKPANIMVDSHGEPRILDFGLAKREGIDDSMTQEGQLVGTIVYMSPEQANGHVKMISGASDQYSLGIILFQMITGELPFRGAGNMVLRQIVLDDPPNPRSLNDSISRDLENICLKTLSKKISDRYASTAEFAKDLRRYLNYEPVEARPVGVVGKLERWARRNRTLATSLASIAAILILATLVSTYFAFKSFNDLQARIAAEEAGKQAQIKLLLEGDPAELRPVIVAFRQNLQEYEPDLRSKQNDPQLDARKQARVLLALCDKEPALEEKLYQLIDQLSTPDALLVNEFLKKSPSKEREQQLWSTLKNRQATPSQRLIAAVVLGKVNAQHPNWVQMGQPVLEDLLDPASTLHLRLWIQQLKPIWGHLQKPLIKECSKNTDSQRSILATTVYFQFFGNDIPGLMNLLAEIIPANMPMVINQLKLLNKAKDVQTALRKLAEPGADRSALIIVPANLPAPSEAIVRKLEASAGIVHPSFAICSALTWPDVASVMKEMAACGYRPVRFRPYSTTQGLRAAVIWHRDSLPGSAGWDFAYDLSDKELETKVNQLRAKNWMLVEAASYDVERRAGENEVRYAVISMPAPPKTDFKLLLDHKESSYLENNQKWLFSPSAIFHRTGILDLEKGALPIAHSVRGTQPGQATFTQILSTIPAQRGIESFMPSFGLALSEDKFRLTQADFNIHHDIAWVVPDTPTSRLAYFTQMRDNARRLINERKMTELVLTKSLPYFSQLPDSAKGSALAHRIFDLLFLQANFDQTRASYELSTDPEWINESRQLAGNEQLSAEFDALLALYWSRAGEKELAELCSTRYTQRKSSDLRQSVFLTSAVQILLNKSKAVPDAVKALDQATRNFPDSLSRFLQCRLYCLAAETLNSTSPEGKPYLDKAWPLAKQVIQDGEGPGYELDEFWSRDFAPLADKLEPLLQNKRKQLRYCTTWSPARQLDQRLHYGETADLALPLWQTWLAEGYVPHTISAIEWQGKVRLITTWRRARPNPEQDAAAAHRRANAQLTLARLDDPADTWKSLENASVSNVDAELANELIFRAARCKVSPQLLVTRLLQPCTPLLKHRLLIALGQYSLEECGPAQKELLQALTQWLLNDPDSGVHAACDWLLRTWKQDALMQAAWKGQDRTLEKRENRLWYRSKTGQEYIIFPDPPPFYMGISVDDTEATFPSRERPHFRRIGHAYALASKEVTRKEFLEFNPQHNAGDLRFAPTDDCPVGSIRWAKAAEYCNWLSQKEGIPPNQWCYVVDQKSGAVSIAPNYLERTGYRLPVEAEFEYACRGNSRTIRFFGNSPKGIHRYVWFSDNSDRQLHPVGSLPPSPKGLFDLFGNGSEWQNNKSMYYPSIFGLETVQDQSIQLAEPNLATPISSLVIKSLSWGADANFIRTSQRSSRSVRTESEAMDLGFRVGRTLFLNP